MVSQSIKAFTLACLLTLASGRVFSNEPAPAPTAAPAAAEAPVACKQHEKHAHKHGEKCGHKSHVHKAADGSEHTCYEHGKHHHMVHEGHTDECEHKS